MDDDRDEKVQVEVEVADRPEVLPERHERQSVHHPVLRVSLPRVHLLLQPVLDVGFLLLSFPVPTSVQKSFPLPLPLPPPPHPPLVLVWSSTGYRSLPGSCRNLGSRSLWWCTWCLPTRWVPVPSSGLSEFPRCSPSHVRKFGPTPRHLGGRPKGCFVPTGQGGGHCGLVWETVGK